MSVSILILSSGYVITSSHSWFFTSLSWQPRLTSETFTHLSIKIVFFSCCCSPSSHPSSGNLSKKEKIKPPTSHLSGDGIILMFWLLLGLNTVKAVKESYFTPCCHSVFTVPLICVQTHHLSIYLAVCSGEHLSPGGALCLSVFISSLSDLHHGSLTNVFPLSTRDHLLQRAPNNERQDGRVLHSDDGRDLPLL